MADMSAAEVVALSGLSYNFSSVKASLDLTLSTVVEESTLELSRSPLFSSLSCLASAVVFFLPDFCSYVLLVTDCMLVAAARLALRVLFLYGVTSSFLALSLTGPPTGILRLFVCFGNI